MTPSDEPTARARDGATPGEPERGAPEAPAAGSAGPAPTGTLKLKDRVVPDPPQMDQSHGRQACRFVIALVAVTVLVMAGVLTLNVIADPYGSVGARVLPTVTTSDRTVKADRIEELDEPPELVVLGSSRSMRYEPSYLEEKTGLRGFNAGVNGIGGTADVWAMTRFIHDTWPDADPAYLWLLDVESFVPFEIGARTAGEPRLARYVDQSSLGDGVGGSVRAIAENRSTLFSLGTAYDSARLLLQPEEAERSQGRYGRLILADGSMTPRARRTTWKHRWPRSVKRYRSLHRDAFRRLDPTAEENVERTLAFMNEQGQAPIIALTPVNPKLRRVLAPLGWDDRHEEVVAYVESLRADHDFVFLDLTDPAVFGFDRREWYDGVHMTTVNTRRAIDHILAQTGGWPPQQPPAPGE